jgi:transcription-repair coupling factor (superfamily II helicase)
LTCCRAHRSSKAAEYSQAIRLSSTAGICSGRETLSDCAGGRGAARAYAYLLYDKTARLTEDARKRLETIREATELGMGYSIAMRDLEIRGAGELLGHRQSGHIAAVGFDLYTRLLSRSVEEMRAAREGRPLPPPPISSVTIDLPLPAYLPTDYVADDTLRLQLYRRLGGLGSNQAIEDIEQELQDRFGPLPEPARNLMFQLRIKVMAQKAAEFADEYIKGKRDFQQKIPVKVELVTPENVGKYGDYGRKE